MARIKQTTLTKFIKDECANYNKHYQECLSGDECKVLSGERCGYFEKSVLGPLDYPYRLPGYDYSKLFAQYADRTGAKKRKVKVRRCDCGSPLRQRQRYCDSCAKMRAKAANRERQRKHRLLNSLNVTL
jgi:hypothetical protein